jgi:hypothetical protein
LQVSVDGIATNDELAKEDAKSLNRESDNFILELPGGSALVRLFATRMISILSPALFRIQFAKINSLRHESFESAPIKLELCQTDHTALDSDMFVASCTALYRRI